MRLRGMVGSEYWNEVLTRGVGNLKCFSYSKTFAMWTDLAGNAISGCYAEGIDLNGKESTHARHSSSRR